MPDFPELDPETLAQAMKTYITARQNDTTSDAQLGSSNYFEVLHGMAEGIAAAANPSLSYFENNDQNLSASTGQGSSSSSDSLTFTLLGTAIVGQCVVQVSDNTVSASDSSTFVSGPVVGIITSFPTTSTVVVQSTGSYTYSGQDSFSFLPMTPDSTYYASATSGEITLAPTPPSGGFVQPLGYSKTAYQFVLSIQDPIEI